MKAPINHISRSRKMRADDDSLRIAPITKPRSGWTEAFREMARQEDNVLIDSSLTAVSSWDENDWEWW